MFPSSAARGILTTAGFIGVQERKREERRGEGRPVAPSGGSLLSGVWGSGVLGFSFFFSILVLGSLLLVF